MKDIQVFTALDAKTVAAEKLDILLLSTEGAADMAIYNDLEKLKAAFPGKKVAAMADKMFNQDNTLADTLIRKVRVAGIENPQNVGGTASRIEIAWSWCFSLLNRFFNAAGGIFQTAYCIGQAFADLFDMLVPFAALEVFGDVVPVFFFLSLDFLKLSLEGLKLINDGLQGLSAFSVHIYSP